MKNGPVPSFIYDMIKFVRGDKQYISLPQDVKSDFELFDYKYIAAKRAANGDELAESDIECLERSMSENKDYSFLQLTKISHDNAWENADINGEISVFDMASSDGADIDMLKYIKLNMENQNSFACP
jgi:hypothetical protein